MSGLHLLFELHKHYICISFCQFVPFGCLSPVSLSFVSLVPLCDNVCFVLFVLIHYLQENRVFMYNLFSQLNNESTSADRLRELVGGVLVVIFAHNHESFDSELIVIQLVL